MQECQQLKDNVDLFSEGQIFCILYPMQCILQVTDNMLGLDNDANSISSYRKNILYYPLTLSFKSLFSYGF